jgi:hypothetical protein
MSKEYRYAEAGPGGGALKRRFDGLAEHELLADQAHREIHGLPHQNLAPAAGHAGERARDMGHLVRCKESPGQRKTQAAAFTKRDGL